MRAKLEAGEISAEEFKELFEKFKELGLLEPETKRINSLTVTGKKAYDHDLVVEGPVTVAGILRVSGDLECHRLGIAGSGHVSGEVRVNGKCSINGKLDGGKDIKVAGDCTITGKCFASNGMYCIGKMTVAGKLIAPHELVVGGKLKILGKVTVGSVECSSDVVLQGNMRTTGNVVAERILSPKGGSSSINGDLIAKEVQIGRVGRDSDDFGDFLGKLVTSFIGIKNDPSFHVKGSVRGRKVVMENSQVDGDIIADVVRLGENVQVKGRIFYTQSIDVPSALKGKSKQITNAE